MANADLMRRSSLPPIEPFYEVINDNPPLKPIQKLVIKSTRAKKVNMRTNSRNTVPLKTINFNHLDTTLQPVVDKSA